MPYDEPGDEPDADQQEELEMAAAEFQTAVKEGSPADVVTTYKALKQLCEEYAGGSYDDGEKKDGKPMGLTVVLAGKPKK